MSPRWVQEPDDDSTPPSSPPVAAAIPRRSKFDDEEDDSDVVESWDAAEDSEAEAEKAKAAADAKAKAEAQAAASKKSKVQRIAEKKITRKPVDSEESSSEEDTATTRQRLRQTEQDADLKHAEDLFGNVSITKSRSGPKAVVAADPSNPSSSIDLSSIPLFNPSTKDQFLQLREALVPLLTSQSKKAHYTIFLQEFTKQIVKELTSEQIKKIASGLTTLSNEKMKEEKAADKGQKRTKAAKTKATLVANRDASTRADTTLYEGGLDDDIDFM